MTSPLIFADGGTIDSALRSDDHSLILMSTSARTVSSGQVGDLVDRFMSLSDNPEFGRRYAQKVVLVFDGYDDDPRELPQIPEVRTFVQAVARAWPFAFHFLSPEFESLRLYLQFLVPIRHEGLDSRTGITRVSADIGAARQVVQQHLDAMNALHAAIALPENERRQIHAKIAADLSYLYP